MSGRVGVRASKLPCIALILALGFIGLPVRAQELLLPENPVTAEDFASPGGFGAAGMQDAPVTATLAFDVSAIVSGESFTAIITLVHEDGWHTYGIDSGDSGNAGLPTTIEWKLPPGLSAGQIIWPVAQEFDDRGIKSRGYTGVLELHVPLRADKTLRTDTPLTIGATVNWLACKTSCVPGQATFDYRLPVAKATTASRAAALFLAILSAFAGGLILNLMPCVLPVLSLKLHSLIVQSGSPRKDSIRNGLAYAFGVLVSFWILAGTLIAIKAGGSAAGWGFQFQSPQFVAIMALFFTAFALNMLGVFEIGTGTSRFTSGLASKSIPKEGFSRAFFSGLLATAAATPCTAPFMGAAVGYALSASPLAAFLIFGSLALGLSSPILVLSAFPSLASRLPKPGRWMETLKNALGFFLLATVLWLFSVLSSLAGTRVVIPALAGLLGTGVAAWVWGRWDSAEFSSRARVIARIISAVIFASSIFFVMITMPATGATDARESAYTSANTSNQNEISEGAGRLPWQAYDAELLADLRARNVPVFLDFGADWCLSCKANEFAVLDRAAVTDEFAKRGVVALKADWTRSDPAITKALASYGRSSVPLYLLFIPGREKPLILPEILTIPIVLKALEEIR